MFAHRGYLSIMIFLQEIASRKIFLGAYLALKFQKKHKNEIIRRKIRAKNTRRYEKHARKKNQKKFHRSLRIRRPGVRVPFSAPKIKALRRAFSFFVCSRVAATTAVPVCKNTNLVRSRIDEMVHNFLYKESCTSCVAGARPGRYNKSIL